MNERVGSLQEWEEILRKGRYRNKRKRVNKKDQDAIYRAGDLAQ